MCWNLASFDVWKVVYTARGVDLRIGEWEADCQHIAERLCRSTA
jgi:hypothetical protein